MKRNDLLIVYGNKPKEMVLQLLAEIRPELELKEDMRIGIKPNLVVAKPADSGATTSPQLVAGIIEYLQDKGFSNLCILEGSWVGERTERAFKRCGYNDISQKYNVPLIDLQKDKSSEYKTEDLNLKICDQVMALDYLINVPVMKGHCQTKMTCALKNMKGCIPDSEKRRFHALGLHKPIARLNQIIRQDLIIIDGLMGDLNFEEGGNPVQMNRLIAAKDPVLADAYVASLMGFTTDDIPYIRLAAQFGVGSSDLDLSSQVELNHDFASASQPKARQFHHYERLIDENQACSACYGSLIHALERLNEKGELPYIQQKLRIGQYFKEKCCDGIGIGECTRQFEHFIRGCPPKSKDIVDYLIKSHNH